MGSHYSKQLAFWFSIFDVLTHCNKRLCMLLFIKKFPYVVNFSKNIQCARHIVSDKETGPPQISKQIQCAIHFVYDREMWPPRFSKIQCAIHTVF